ncbi:MAG: ferredoxin family protein [Planctomycetaceae bacterium]|nr:ferredoxin family protein [Planctomycetaceae bacterium]
MNIPLFLFRKTPPADDPEAVQRETCLLKEMKTVAGLQIYSGYSLYDYSESSDFVRKIQAARFPMAVISWQSVRATRWLLRKLREDFTEEETLMIDLSEQKSVNEILTVIQKFLDRFGDTASTETKMETETLIPSRRWYPVIDYGKCISCLECVNFCLFGVYTIDKENRSTVCRPDSCRDGCPACSRVCPAGAIIFPEYDDPVISGRMEAVSSSAPAVSQPLALQKSDSAKPELDRLIDQLEDFDL